MKVIYYDNQFNLNEWFIIGALVIGVLVVVLLPKRFTQQTTIVFITTGVFFGFFADHGLSVLPVSFYDVNDSSHFEVMDFFSHIMYGPYSYLFFYLFHLLNVKPRYTPIYVLAWAFVSLGMEIICKKIGIFHYRHGFNFYYSFVIYLLVLSFWVYFYSLIMKYGNKEL
ncbi:hypothetical protein [Robertmurraya massiliosenegalensis]|uniref:hypothetical protein n=1 Tax=Robertmurraya massiliosenegalensis TaxID=1287657 RepID=UPI0002EB9F34|nr:hypothetical protein [Robertmurraya massiliosenegalensis]